MTPPPEDIAREAAEECARKSGHMVGIGVPRACRHHVAEAIRQAVEQERAQHEQVLASVRRFLALSSQFDRWIIEADRSWLRAFHEAEKAVGR